MKGVWHVIDAEHAIAPGRFYHIGLTYSKTIFISKLLLHRTFVHFPYTTLFRSQTSYDLYLGTRPPGDGYNPFFAGIIDEIRICSPPLTIADIKGAHKASSAGKCLPTGPCTPAPANLVSWWRAESNALDSAGTNH